jgi:hypothetical protein
LLTPSQIFDVPSIGTQPFEERIAFARKLFGKGGKYASMHRIKVLEQECVRDREHVLDKLKEIEGLGGEGVMLRKPQSWVHIPCARTCAEPRSACTRASGATRS